MMTDHFIPYPPPSFELSPLKRTGTSSWSFLCPQPNILFPFSSIFFSLSFSPNPNFHKPSKSLNIFLRNIQQYTHHLKLEATTNSSWFLDHLFIAKKHYYISSLHTHTYRELIDPIYGFLIRTKLGLQATKLLYAFEIIWR